MKVLVTGGAGYIGSHTCVALLEAGHDLTVIDNLCNSSEVALQRVQDIAARPLRFVRGDIRNPDDLASAFEDAPDAVIHFAALKAVGESCEKPLDYFDNNIGGTINLLQAMRRAKVRNLVFSSSATVYGEPVTEDAPLPVDVCDPWVDADEARHKYGIDLTTPGEGEYDAVVVAVAYEELRELGASRIRAHGKPGAVLYDVKCVLPKEAVDGRL